jgi:hypothetical protein
MHSPLFVRPGVRRAVGRGLSLSLFQLSPLPVFFYLCLTAWTLDFFWTFVGEKPKKDRGVTRDSLGK